MDLSELYNGKLSTIINYQHIIEEKVKDTIINILKSPEFEPKIIEYIIKHIEFVLIYIYSVKNDQDLGEEGESICTLNYDRGYINSIFKSYQTNYLMDLYEDIYPWDICEGAIEVIHQPQIFAKLSENNVFYHDDGYNYSYVFESNCIYHFMADIFERLLKEKTDWFYEQIVRNVEHNEESIREALHDPGEDGY